MIEGSLGLLVEGLVSVLLVATIFYCISVNRKLERLRDEQKGMRAFIRELLAATDNADKAIKGLRETVQASGTELAGQISKGKKTGRMLRNEIDNAEQTLNKLVLLTRRTEKDSVSVDFAGKTGASGSSGGEDRVEELRRSMLGFEDLEESRGDQAPSWSSLPGDRAATATGTDR